MYRFGLKPGQSALWCNWCRGCSSPQRVTAIASKIELDEAPKDTF